MSILVRNIDGVWQEWHGEVDTQQMVSTFVAQYADGRSVEMPCDPYPITVRVNGDNVARFYDQDIWSLEEVQAVGGAMAQSFAAPEGKQMVGAPSYVETDGVIQQVYEVEDILPPPPLPTAEEKVASMLSAFGVTLEELKAILGLDA